MPWKRGAWVVRARSLAGLASHRPPRDPTLDDLIPAEIHADPFAEIIEEIASTEGIHEILEIGSSSGQGSTAAWVRGALRNPVLPHLHCIEVSTARYVALAQRWREHNFVRCYNVSSVPPEKFPSPAEVERFYNNEPSRLRDFELDKVLGWLKGDVDYLRDHSPSSCGIEEIKQRNGIEAFDAVLIDGSEFAGKAELSEVYGARFLLLDDTETFKNWENTRRLSADPGYRTVRYDPNTRYGFAVFERMD